MTISTLPARNEYTANAGQTVFNYTFKIFTSTDLNVYVTPAGQAPNDSTDLRTDYTVTGIDDESGGTIIFNTGITNNYLVTIVSNIPSNRTTDYQNNSDFRPNVVNDDFDRVVSITKKIEDTVNRTLLLPQSQQDPKPLSLPDPVAGYSVRWNGDASGLENFQLASGASPAGENVINYASLDVAVNDVNMVLGQASNLKERTTGNGGGAMWDTVLASTVTPNGYNIVQCVGVPTLALVLRKSTPQCVTQYGAYAGAPAATNSAAIQACWNDNLSSSMPEGVFQFDTPLTYIQQNGWSFSGANDKSVLEYTGSAESWAITSPVIADGGGGVYGVTLSRFKLKGEDGTYDKKLLNFIYTRYSLLSELYLEYALVTFRHSVGWGNKVYKCTFAPEADKETPVLQTVAIWLADTGGATSVSNALNFDACRIERAEDGVLNEGGGRNITFTNGTIFEQNNKHISFRGASFVREFIVSNCYIELAHVVPLYLDMASLNGDFDGIQIKDTMITDGGGLASLCWLDGVTSSSSVRISFINNTIEFPTALNQPSTGLALYTPNGSANVNIEYRTNFQPLKGAGVSFVFNHYDPETINIPSLSTNVPINLVYTNGSDALPFVPVGNSKLTATPDNGYMRIQGTAVNVNNVTTATQPIATIPASALPNYAAIGEYRNGTSPFSHYMDVAGGTLNANNLAGMEAHIDFSYLMVGGNRVFNET